MVSHIISRAAGAGRSVFKTLVPYVAFSLKLKTREQVYPFGYPGGSIKILSDDFGSLDLVETSDDVIFTGVMSIAEGKPGQIVANSTQIT